MPGAGSVTQWITQLKAGEVAALAKLHKRYWPILTKLADKKLARSKKRFADEEDVAQEAFLGFYQSLRRGGFPKLNDRHDLLAVLAVVTAHKAAHQRDRESRKKRGGGNVQGESVLLGLAEFDASGRGVEQVAGDAPTPQEQAILNDCYHRYMNTLPETLKPFAELYLSGHSYREIAETQGCVKRTVERKIPLILKRWQSLSEGMIKEEVPADVPADNAQSDNAQSDDAQSDDAQSDDAQSDDAQSNDAQSNRD